MSVLCKTIFLYTGRQGFPRFLPVLDNISCTPDKDILASHQCRQFFSSPVHAPFCLRMTLSMFFYSHLTSMEYSYNLTLLIYQNKIFSALVVKHIKCLRHQVMLDFRTMMSTRRQIMLVFTGRRSLLELVSFMFNRNHPNL